MEKIKLPCIVGPTASGKTRLGICLAKELDGEVVSADSMQIYRGLDIATAKPTEAEMDGVRHHLIGFLDPSRRYSVADFVRDAAKAIEEIKGRGKLPILVGGTGLYISSLVDHIEFSETTGSDQIRASLYDIAERQGSEQLYRMLLSIDPEYGKTLHPNNVGRVARAIEVYETTGKPMSWHLLHSRRNESPYDPILVGLTFQNREVLYERIDRRVDAMMDAGLLAEAESVLREELGKTAFQAIGYKELAPYFAGEKALEDCVEEIKRGTRRYAKRQLTWFRRDKRTSWIEIDRYPGFEEVTEAALALMKTNLQR